MRNLALKTKHFNISIKIQIKQKSFVSFSGAYQCMTNWPGFKIDQTLKCDEKFRTPHNSNLEIS